MSHLYNLHLVMGLFGSPQSTHYYANVERAIDTSGILMMEYDGFQAMCMAAKDCRGMTGMVIQGTKGCIKTNMSPNMIGKVTLEWNDGTAEEYEEPHVRSRLIPEFMDFVKAINTRDMAYCQTMLDKSIAVSRVQTEARLGAGIRFPADEREF